MGVVLSRISSLDLLLTDDGPLEEKFERSEIKLQFIDLSSSENKRWEDRINRYYFSCGCPQGAIFIMLAIVCHVSYIFLRPPNFYINWSDIGIGLGIFIISGALGKIFGLALDKIRLKKTIFDLKKILQERARENQIQ